MQKRLFYISELIGKDLNGTISVDETADLNRWVESSIANKQLFEQLHNEAFVMLQLEKFDRYDVEKNRAYLLGKLEEVHPQTVARDQRSIVNPSAIAQGENPKAKNIQLWKRIAVAASIVGVLFVGYWMMRPSTTLSPANDPSTVAHDVEAPDKTRAQIKLADGTTVYLDSVGNGALASQAGISVIKTADGRIEYNGASTSLSMQYNTLSNPRGSIVMNMTLSDGSRVWLNAGSSVTYPVAFVGNERKVTITGEAYFEVAHNAEKPFYVSKGDVSVQVLGTHFNVNAYDDESEIKVTLLEGKVNVSTKYDVRGTTIKPGEQAIAMGNGQLAISKDVDVEAVMAWKNGQFSFNNADLKIVMRQVERWYDVEVIYEGPLPNEEFNGGTSRQDNVSALLKVLEATGKVKFRVEGKKVFVRR
jgi:transmembrane sensor